MEENKLRLIKEPLRTLLGQLIDRCEKVGFEYELGELGDFRMQLPSGRDRRAVYALDLEDVEKISEVEFEKYVFVPDIEQFVLTKMD